MICFFQDDLFFNYYLLDFSFGHYLISNPKSLRTKVKIMHQS